MSINYEIKKQTPDNINDLVEMAGDRNNWRKRLEAINELKKWSKIKRCLNKTGVIFI